MKEEEKKLLEKYPTTVDIIKAIEDLKKRVAKLERKRKKKGETE